MFNMEEVTYAFEVVQRNMRSVIGPRNYDEVAVMVRNPMDASWLCREFEKAGFGHKFNKSVDTVTTRPIVTEYDVTYRFLSVSHQTFRIEVMNFTRGQSPAHIPAQQRLGLGEDAVVIHVSYKPPGKGGIDNYQAEKKILESRGLEHVQECRSTYGIFSYWLHPDLPEGIYLKPRINLRDPENKLQSMVSEALTVDEPLQRITEEQFIPASERVETDTILFNAEMVKSDTIYYGGKPR